MMQKTKELNLCEGSIFKKMIIYSLPLMGTNLLQFLFNVVDIAVLAAFVGDNAVAAVGATGSIVHLLVNLFIGISVGANVMLARSVGEQDSEKAKRIVGTSMQISLIIGFSLLFIGVFGAKTFLRWTKCDEEVLTMATKYLQIYFLGMPIMMLYNFSSSILRAVGDTVRPFIYLTIGGVANVGLNIFFVTVLHKDVEGVAIATVASQGIAAILSVWTLLRSNGYGKFSWKYFKIDKKMLGAILRFGIPAGLQSSMFALANVVITRYVNSFGAKGMAGNTAAVQIESFIFQITTAIGHTTAAFVGQNYGARQVDRMRQSVISTTLYAFVVCGFFGLCMLIFKKPLCGIFSKDPVVLSYAYTKVGITGGFMMFYGMLDTLGNAIRGLGKSFLALVINFFGICLFRLLWIVIMFKVSPTYNVICWAYALSFVLTFTISIIMYFPSLKSAKRRLEN